MGPTNVKEQKIAAPADQCAKFFFEGGFGFHSAKDGSHCKILNLMQSTDKTFILFIFIQSNLII